MANNNGSYYEAALRRRQKEADKLVKFYKNSSSIQAPKPKRKAAEFKVRQQSLKKKGK